ncbi:rhodanese-like domain-containing protein [Streptomyces luteogriseus]|uniref:rhodanese-like domain-containing protein n=1 Tax=Streptomyces luteogriseus TaxID=68233 RepID=UPI003795D264
MFPFLRHDPGRLCPREPFRRTSGGTAALPGIRGTAERRAGHTPGTPHLLPPSPLPAGAPLPPVARGGPVVTVRRSGHHTPPVTGEGDPGGVIP